MLGSLQNGIHQTSQTMATQQDQAGIKVQGGHRYRYLPISWNMPQFSKQLANQQTFETQDSK
jgi:hypothetical protein